MPQDARGVTPHLDGKGLTSMLPPFPLSISLLKIAFITSIERKYKNTNAEDYPKSEADGLVIPKASLTVGI